MTQAQMNLGVFAVGAGNHVGGWRHPGATQHGEDIAAYIELARTAESAKFDLMFMADNVQCSTSDHPGFMSRLEPFTCMSAVAAMTAHIGLVGSGSTSWAEPYNLARLVGSLDHISGGRAGWNLVTTNTPMSAENFGGQLLDHDLRYEIAAEYVEVVKGLWDSWEPDAKCLDAESGQYVVPGKVHTLNHAGAHFRVRGPLNLSRCPQGQPVIFQAGSSQTGQAFAARYADVVLTVQLDLDVAIEFREQIKRLACTHGRDPSAVKVMPGLLPVVGSTEEEAHRKLDQLGRYVDENSALQTMTDRIGHDFSSYDLDGPIPDLPLPDQVQGYARMMLTEEYRARYRLRDLYNLFAVSRGYKVVCGAPGQVADELAAWFQAGACDGFVLTPAHFPEALEDFVDGVVPLLRERGLFRTDYAGTTLRSHLGLPSVTNRYVEDVS